MSIVSVPPLLLSSPLQLPAGCPPHWELDHTGTLPMLVLLDGQKHAAELAEVTASWRHTGGLGSIVSVHRVQNPALLQRFVQHKQQLGWSHRELQVWHGTRTNDPALIYATPTGFDMSRGDARAG